MTLAALQTRVGADDFWEILRTWVADNAGGNGSTADFQALAEQVSGADLDAFVDAWLFSRDKPANTTDNGLGC